MAGGGRIVAELRAFERQPISRERVAPVFERRIARGLRGATSVLGPWDESRVL